MSSETGDPRGEAPPPSEEDFSQQGGGGGDPRDRGSNNRGGGRALAVQKPGEARLPFPTDFAVDFDISKAMWLALTDSVFPTAKTTGAILLAAAYCKERKLDIMKKPVHIVPMWNSDLGREVETVWPAITEHRITAHRTGEFAGNDPATFGDTVKNQKFSAKYERDKPGYLKGKMIEATLLAYPEWAQMTVYRMVQGQVRAFPGPRVYFNEYFGMQHGLPVPNARWTRAPFQMLEKCAEAAALRRAFTEELGNMPVADEMEDRIIAQHVPFADREEPRPDPAAKTAQNAGTSQPKNETRRDPNVRDAEFTEDGRKGATDKKTADDGKGKAKPADAKGPEPGNKEKPKPAEPARDRIADYVREQIEVSKKLDEPTLIELDGRVRDLIKTEGDNREDLIQLWQAAYDTRVKVLKRPPLSDKEQAYEDWKADQYETLRKASMSRTIDDLEDSVLPDLKEEDKAAFKAACNERAKALFAAKAKK